MSDWHIEVARWFNATADKFVGAEKAIAEHRFRGWAQRSQADPPSAMHSLLSCLLWLEPDAARVRNEIARIAVCATLSWQDADWINPDHHLLYNEYEQSNWLDGCADSRFEPVLIGRDDEPLKWVACPQCGSVFRMVGKGRLQQHKPIAAGS